MGAGSQGTSVTPSWGTAQPPPSPAPFSASPSGWRPWPPQQQAQYQPPQQPQYRMPQLGGTGGPPQYQTPPQQQQPPAPQPQGQTPPPQPAPQPQVMTGGGQGTPPGPGPAPPPPQQPTYAPGVTPWQSGNYGGSMQGGVITGGGPGSDTPFFNTVQQPQLGGTGGPPQQPQQPAPQPQQQGLSPQQRQQLMSWTPSWGNAPAMWNMPGATSGGGPGGQSPADMYHQQLLQQYQNNPTGWDQFVQQQRRIGPLA